MVELFSVCILLPDFWVVLHGCTHVQHTYFAFSRLKESLVKVIIIQNVRASDADLVKESGIVRSIRNFEREAITADSLLYKQNLQILGIPNASDMMKLWAESVKYGKSKPQKI